MESGKGQKSDDKQADKGGKRVYNYNLVFYGPPGVGKGTQARLLAEDLGLLHLSAGQILRREKSRRETFLGRYIEQNFRVETLIGVTCELIKNEITKRKGGVIIDGCPKSRKDAEHLLKVLRQSGVKIDIFFSFNMTLDSVKKRLQKRLIHKASGRVYHPKYNPPKVAGKDDLTGEPLEKRKDDSIVGIEGRYGWYDKNAKEILDYLKEYSSSDEGADFKIVEIDAENKTIPEMHKLIKAAILEKDPLTTEYKSSYYLENKNKVSAIEGAIVLQKINELLESRYSARKFPGMLLKPIDNKDLGMLSSRDYLFAPKIDGERNLCLLSNGFLYFISRNEMENPTRAPQPISYLKEFENTLLDGELVDAPGKPGAKIYVVFDCLVHNGVKLGRFVPDRARAITFVTDMLKKKNKGVKEFGFEEQNYRNLRTISTYFGSEMYKQRENRFKMAVHGIILVPSNAYIHLGYAKHCLKWKPVQDVTIDFKVRFPTDDDESTQDAPEETADAKDTQDAEAKKGEGEGDSTPTETQNGDGQEAAEVPEDDGSIEVELLAVDTHKKSWGKLKVVSRMRISKEELEQFGIKDGDIIECGYKPSEEDAESNEQSAEGESTDQTDEREEQEEGEATTGAPETSSDEASTATDEASTATDETKSTDTTDDSNATQSTDQEPTNTNDEEEKAAESDAIDGEDKDDAGEEKSEAEEQEKGADGENSESPSMDQWEIRRVRTDKSAPNADFVVRQIIKYFKHPVSEEDLSDLKYIPYYARERYGGRGRSRGSRGNRGYYRGRGRRGGRGKHRGKKSYEATRNIWNSEQSNNGVAQRQPRGGKQGKKREGDMFFGRGPAISEPAAPVKRGYAAAVRREVPADAIPATTAGGKNGRKRGERYQPRKQNNAGNNTNTKS